MSQFGSRQQQFGGNVFGATWFNNEQLGIFYLVFNILFHFYDGPLYDADLLWRRGKGGTGSVARAGFGVPLRAPRHHAFPPHPRERWTPNLWGGSRDNGILHHRPHNSNSGREKIGLPWTIVPSGILSDHVVSVIGCGPLYVNTARKTKRRKTWMRIFWTVSSSGASS